MILNQRRSLPSSYITGLIGWNGFTLIIALLWGIEIPISRVFLLGSLAAITQVTLLRLFFFSLGMQKSVWLGTLWGTLSGALVIFVEVYAFPELKNHLILWISNGIYVGAAVGTFLSYFYRDDRKIEAEFPKGPIDYGRDGRWLDPFIYGAIVYLVVFVPRSIDLALCALVIGAMSGVVAAGGSHFFVNAKSRDSWLPLLLAILVGVGQGLASAYLFLKFREQLFLSPWIHGAMAGALTYLWTTLKGKSLAAQEA